MFTVFIFVGKIPTQSDWFTICVSPEAVTWDIFFKMLVEMFSSPRLFLKPDIVLFSSLQEQKSNQNQKSMQFFAICTWRFSVSQAASYFRAVTLALKIKESNIETNLTKNLWIASVQILDIFYTSTGSKENHQHLESSSFYKGNKSSNVNWISNLASKLIWVNSFSNTYCESRLIDYSWYLCHFFTNVGQEY